VDVIWKSNDSLVGSKRFYYQKTPIFKMETIQDSVYDFINQHYSDSVLIKQFDSIYFSERIGNLKTDDTKQYSDKGYFCICND